MIAVRGLAFLSFVLLGLLLAGWQVLNVRTDLAEAGSGALGAVLLGLALGIPATQAVVVRFAAPGTRRWLYAAAALPVLPLIGVVGGLLSAVQGKGGRHGRIWEVSCIIGALLCLNGALPMALGEALRPGGGGLALGWMAVKLQFFLVVDYFLARALLYYFNSGASAFVSLRYLRRRVISLLSVLGIAMGVWVLIVVNSVMTGFQTDFREQVRGSLSHVLVRVESRSAHAQLDNRELAAAEWAEYVRRIEADSTLAAAWQAVVDAALKRFRDSGDKDGDGLLDLPEALRGQPPLEPPPGPDTSRPELSADDKAFLERLKTGRGLSDFDRECLRDGEKVTSPREFYLARVAAPQVEEEDARRGWYFPQFRERLAENFAGIEGVLQAHRNAAGEPDVRGVSWRVATKTFITPKQGVRELPIAELVGVDVERENTISQLGEYVAAAEVNSFRQQFVVDPLLNVLAATLGWETPESLESLGATPSFMFTEDGKGTGPILPDLRATLARRGFTTATGGVRWSEFDRVRYHDFTPGYAIYSRVRDAIKDASRSEDPAVLGEVLRLCLHDVEALVLPILEQSPTERSGQVAHTGCRILLRMYLRGMDRTKDALRDAHQQVTDPVREQIGEADPALPPAELEVLKALSAAADSRARAMEAVNEDLQSTELAREQALRDAVAGLRDDTSAALARAEAGNMNVAELLRVVAASLAEPDAYLPLRRSLRARRPLPLSYAASQFSEHSAQAEQRRDAYRKVLPLRAMMRPGESAEDYLARARKEGERPEGLNGGERLPGLILGDALAESAMLGGVTIGDSIAVTIPRIYYEDSRLVPRTTEVWFRVTGFFRSGLYEDNLGRMYCDFEELAAILGDSEVRYFVGARLADYAPYEGVYRGDKLKSELRQGLRERGLSFAGVSVWEDEKRTLLEAVNREKTILGLIVSIIILLAGVLILILVYQLVNEKVKDIGILKALGHSPWGIRSVFMFNALFIGLFGAVLGALGGLITSEYLNEIEDLVDQATGIRLFPPDVYFLTYIPSVKGAALLRLALDIAAPVVLFSFGCGILPARLAAQKDPVEALHYE
ncbi:MAG: hypothetical protein IT463_04670 [Planctomycetes bacterium]|nr:hypothetical protein [Planctomycetota bacterium]